MINEKNEKHEREIDQYRVSVFQTKHTANKMSKL